MFKNHRAHLVCDGSQFRTRLGRVQGDDVQSAYPGEAGEITIIADQDELLDSVSLEQPRPFNQLSIRSGCAPTA